MRAIASVVTGCAAIGVALCCSAVSSGAPLMARSAGIGLLAIGQTGGSHQPVSRERPATPPSDPFAARGGSFAPGKPSPNSPPASASRGQSTGNGPQFAPQFSGPVTRFPTAGGKAEAMRLISQARLALDRGDLATAKRLAQQAHLLKVPDAQFAPNQMRPWDVLMQIQRAERMRGGVIPAGGAEPLPSRHSRTADYAAPFGGKHGGVRHSVYDPLNDDTRNVRAGSQEPLPPPGAPRFGGGPNPLGAAQSETMRLFDRGMQASRAGDHDKALDLLRQAWQMKDQLDPAVQQTLKSELRHLHAVSATSRSQNGRGAKEPAPLSEVESRQRVLQQKLFREITATRADAERMRRYDPKGGLQKLEELRENVRAAEIDGPVRKQMLTMVDRSINDMRTFIGANRHDIELKEQNEAVRQQVDRDRRTVVEVQEKLAQLVEKFNQLVDEQRFAEAEVVAKQAYVLAPDEAVVHNLMWKSRFIRRFYANEDHRERYEEGLIGALSSVEQSSEPFDDRNPLVFGDVRDWERLTQSRRKWLERQQSRLSPAELEIQSKLKTKVELRFTDRPLGEVMEALGAMAGVNVFLDPEGLRMEGVASDQPITINLTHPVSLRSALNLILEPLRLSYVIQNEVLRVTSEQQKDSDVYTKAYNVADLVIPIPNFSPTHNIGLPAAIREAYITAAQGYAFGQGIQGGAPLLLSDNNAPLPGSGTLAAQFMRGGSGVLGSQRSLQTPQSYGPGGLGGGAQPDFDSLIELITTTISPQTWDEVGGPGSVQGFEGNLSLVISQTQEIHEEIADLLAQLRRLQDLQVTIEVRFITLNDNFFERIGVDFDFEIQDQTGLLADSINNLAGNFNSGVNPGIGYKEIHPSGVVGLNPALDRLPTADLDVRFTQGSFNEAVPQFGGFSPNTAANFGFAILSDIEVFFLLQAAQGDQRTNILQAPKVTLFNGQIATITDTVQQPFVTSIIPVVGDFAAAHQPVIAVLSEGTTLGVQAVVSNDRRFVRLTLVPTFSKIGDVDTFTFNGSTTTTNGTAVIDPTDETVTTRNGVTITQSGTTVQLPTVAITAVATTVSVPDGGTVLLGGIKRLSEGRTERGVPLLSKVPYLNRLFRNVGIGRETSSLMMMVTPRIIIQEEEEEKAVGRPLN